MQKLSNEIENMNIHCMKSLVADREKGEAEGAHKVVIKMPFGHNNFVNLLLALISNLRYIFVVF